MPCPASWPLKIHKHQLSRIVLAQPGDIPVPAEPSPRPAHRVADHCQRIPAFPADIWKNVRLAIEVHALFIHPDRECTQEILAATRSALPVQNETVIAERNSPDNHEQSPGPCHDPLHTHPKLDLDPNISFQVQYGGKNTQRPKSQSLPRANFLFQWWGLTNGLPPRHAFESAGKRADAEHHHVNIQDRPRTRRRKHHEVSSLITPDL